MTPKFVAIIDLTKKKPEDLIVTFITNEPGPVPPIVDPSEPDEPKDGEPPKPKPGERPS